MTQKQMSRMHAILFSKGVCCLIASSMVGQTKLVPFGVLYYGFRLTFFCVYCVAN